MLAADKLSDITSWICKKRQSRKNVFFLLIREANGPTKGGIVTDPNTVASGLRQNPDVFGTFWRRMWFRRPDALLPAYVGQQMELVNNSRPLFKAVNSHICRDQPEEVGGGSGRLLSSGMTAGSPPAALTSGAALG